MSDVAGRNAWLVNMVALGARGGISGKPAQTVDHHGMAAIENLQPLPVTVNASPTVISVVDEPKKSPELRDVGLKINPLMLKQMEDEVVEEVQPLGREEYTEISPSGNVLYHATCKTAEVWKTVKRLKEVSVVGKILRNDEDRDVLKFLEILNCLSPKNTYFWEIKTPKKFVQNPRKHLFQLQFSGFFVFASFF